MLVTTCFLKSFDICTSGCANVNQQAYQALLRSTPVIALFFVRQPSTSPNLTLPLSLGAKRAIMAIMDPLFCGRTSTHHPRQQPIWNKSLLSWDHRHRTRAQALSSWQRLTQPPTFGAGSQDNVSNAAMLVEQKRTAHMLMLHTAHLQLWVCFTIPSLTLVRKCIGISYN